MADGIIRTLPADTPVSLSLRTLGAAPNLLSKIRQAVESELSRRQVSVVREPGAGHAVRLTLSQSVRGLLLIAEIPTPVARSVIIRPLPEQPNSPIQPGSKVKVEVRAELLVERDDPILDALIMEHEILVLGPSKVSVYRRDAVSQEPREVPFRLPAPIPRDPRGRILADQAGATTLLFAGSRCSGTTAQGFACFKSEELWPLTVDARLKARLVPGRNHFDAASMDLKQPRSLTPFFSAARTGDGPEALLLTEGTDGLARLYDAAFSEVGVSSLFGTDFVGITNECGSMLLQARREDASGSLIEIFELINQQPVTVGSPVRLKANVTNIWPSAGNRAIVACRNKTSARYSLYILEITCLREVPDEAAP